MSKMKKCQVVMLPTNEKANILKTNDNKLVYHIDRLNMNQNSFNIGQHIYILSEEKPEDGDWFIRNNEIHQCYKSHKTDVEFKTDINSVYCGINTFWDKKFCKKIIATTDPSLFTEIENQCDGCKANLPLRGNIHIDGQSMGMACSKRRYRDYLPKPSIGFINEFVACYNAKTPITHVMVKYEDISLLPFNDYRLPIWRKCLPLKVNPKDNTITIRKVKDSWNREEVVELLHKCNKDLRLLAGFRLPNWIDQNL